MSSSSPPRILVVGLNPALQKRFVLPGDGRLVPGDVHRAASVSEGVGGKGQDVFVTLSCLQRRSRASILQFVGAGGAGDRVLASLRDGHDLTDDVGTVRTRAPLRTCTTIVAADDATELVEPSGAVEADEVEALLDQVSGGADHRGLCIMGSMPPGCPDHTYADILRRFVASKTKNEPQLCLIDSVSGLAPLFEELGTGASSTVRAVLKINIAELCTLGATATGTLSGHEKVSAAVRGFLEAYRPHAAAALDYVAVTDGKDAAYLVRLGDDGGAVAHLWRSDVPHLQDGSATTTTLYPIGAGDAVAAGTLAAWLELSSQSSSDTLPPVLRRSYDEAVHDPVSTAFAFGLACGSASCLQEQNSVVDTDQVSDIFTKIRTTAVES